MEQNPFQRLRNITNAAMYDNESEANHKQFERLAKAQGYNIQRSSTGEYMDIKTFNAFKGWNMYRGSR